MSDGRTAGRWRVYDETHLDPPLEAALAVFVEQGFHGSSIRLMAARAGLSVPGFYHHYESKQAVLVALVDAAMDELEDRARQALDEAGAGPEARFDALVENQLRFHMARRELAFIASTERRSLEPAARRRLVARRVAQQRLIDDAILEGVGAGVFTAPYPRDAGRAVATMCVSVAQWYSPDGALAPDELVPRYLQIARRIVGVPADRSSNTTLDGGCVP